MYSDRLLKEMSKDFDSIKELLNISDERLNELLYVIPSTEFAKVVEDWYREFSKLMLMKKSINEDELMEEYNAVVALDVNRSFIDSLHFLVSDKAFNKECNYEDLHKIETTEDLLFDFTNDLFLFRISKCRYRMQLGNKYYQVYKGTITIDTDSVSGFSEGDSCATLEFDFVVEKLPRVFFYGEYMGTCEVCKRCSQSEHYIENYNGSINSSGSQVLCGKRNRESGYCILNNCTKQNIGYSIDEILNACLYAVSLYVNRRKRSTDKTESTGVKIQKKVHEPKQNTSVVKMLTLREYNSYERKEKKEWQGGHHSSPIQHERCGYWRHYKNGKKVWIKPCTVNKGKDKGVYKV